MDFFTAFTGGVLSFFSPCILPLLPAFLSTLARGSADFKKKIISVVFFGLGFSLVFVLLGGLAAEAGQFLLEYKKVFYTVMGVVVIILGLNMLGAFDVGFLWREKKFAAPKFENMYVEAFLIGLAFAFGWTPCIGPILAGILTLAMQKEHLYEGMLLLSVYSAGLFLPFLTAAAFSVQVIGKLSKYPKLPYYAEKGAGLILVVMGILLVTGGLSRISAMLA